MEAELKEAQLEQFISHFQCLIVAFSGGVDSSYLAFTAHRLLGSRAICVTAVSPSVSRWQLELARSFSRRHHLNHHEVQTSEVEDPRYAANPVNRCYFCKSEIYGVLESLSRKWEAEAVLDGTNLDDVTDYRPGRQAAKEKEVLSPLLEAGMSKEDIRVRSRAWSLKTWDLPAMPCLSSRFPYGTEITPRKLRQVDRAEAFIRGLGFKNFRVRHHDTLARIEVSQDEKALLDKELKSKINTYLKQLGYQVIRFDPKGFQSGSLNRSAGLLPVVTSVSSQ